MKKIIFTLSVIFLVLFSYTQEPDKLCSPQSGEGTLPLQDLIKMQKTGGDTTWLYHRYDINKWQDGEFYPYFTYLIDYYPETANIKNAVIIENEQDTLQKIDYYYDDNNNFSSTIIMNYTGIAGEEWLNFKKYDHYYNISGWDSLYINYIWDNDDSIWKNDELRGISYYDNGLLRVDSTLAWNGEEWIMNQGYKADYLFNKFGNVYDKKISFYNNQWRYSAWTVYYLTNDTTGEFDSYDNYGWSNDQWEKNGRAIEIVLRNWQGYPNYNIDYEFIKLQSWDGQEWQNIAKDSTVYDNLGSSLNYNFIWNNGKWEVSQRINDVYNERNLRTLLTNEQMINNMWDTIWGNRFSFEYMGSIWSTMHIEDYNTGMMKWVPSYDHILSDFTYILNTPKIEKQEVLSGVRIIPNPVKSRVMIKLIDETDKIKFLKLYSITGQLMFEKRFSEINEQESFNISSFKNGFYILGVFTKNGNTFMEKVVKE